MLARSIFSTCLAGGLLLCVNAAQAEKRDLDKTIADSTAAIRLKPNDPKPYYDRGFAYETKGAPDKAITDFTEAIRLKQDFADAYINQGVSYAMKHDWTKAIADFTDAIQIERHVVRHAETDQPSPPATTAVEEDGDLVLVTTLTPVQANIIRLLGLTPAEYGR